MSTFDEDVAGIGALADPVRRALYQFVCAQPDPVSRDQAADALGLPLHRAKFHLDRLEADGLLATGFARVGEKSGPGAGRTSKLYHRAPREFTVSLPDRDYRLAGRLMADAIAESTSSGRPIEGTLDRVAAAHGAEMAAAAGPARSVDAALEIAADVLRDNGYEPRRDGDRLVLANCPFHALAQQQAALVCGMNRSVLTAFAGSLGPRRLRARLDPGENRCCVVLEP